MRAPHCGWVATDFWSGALYEAVCGRDWAFNMLCMGAIWVPAREWEQCLTEKRRHVVYGPAHTLHGNYCSKEVKTHA